MVDKDLDFKVKNHKVVDGFLNMAFAAQETDYINIENILYRNPNITDEEIAVGLQKLQDSLNLHEKYISDTLIYSAVQHLADGGIHFAEDLGIIDGDRDGMLSDEAMDALKQYANSVNLFDGPEGYKGDIEKYVNENFDLDLTEITYDFELLDGVMINEDFSFSFTPDGNSDIWEGDYIEVDANLFATIEGH